jgi:hypothetical protein
MVLYNVTVKIDDDVHNEWIEWMKQSHIPQVLATGCFSDNKICRILDLEDTDGHTYSIQYLAEDYGTLKRYMTEFAPALQKDHTDRYKDKFVAFRTVMEVVKHTII